MTGIGIGAAGLGIGAAGLGAGLGIAALISALKGEFSIHLDVYFIR